MQLGKVIAEATISKQERLSLLLWGKPTCGKTVLASTAPGKKLWLQFDPNGTASLNRSEDIIVADFSSYKPMNLADFKQNGIIEKDLAKGVADSGIDTIVVDSLTSFGQLALYYGIHSGKANSGKFTASIETPGMSGYGIRTAMILDFCSMVQRIASDNKCHCIFICHERETTDAAGNVTEITLSLGGQGNNVLPARISEIWHMEDTNRVRKVYIRNSGVRQPMRSRMFTSAEVSQFNLTYNQDSGEGDTLATYYERWREAGFNKIAPPK